jgi:polyisoprenoid-binding protein YceI
MEIIVKPVRKLSLAALLALSSVAFAADTYTIDNVHSSANFAVRHMGISTVHGRFTTMSGTIRFDPAAPQNSSVTAVIQASSVDTDNSMRDDDLRSDNFLNAARFPEIRFQSTSIRKTGGDQYLAAGKLTIRDVTRDVEIPFTLAQGHGPKGEPRIGVEGSLTVNRYDYHVNFDKTGALVGKDVKIDLSVEAAR